MSKRIQISFSDEEFKRIEKNSARLNVPPQQFCKDFILAGDLEGFKSKEGMFIKNHAKLISEMKSYAKKHTGTFQLKDLKCWGVVKQTTFDGEEVYPLPQRTALGRAILRDVELGLIPNVRLAMTKENGQLVQKKDAYGIAIYEIYDQEAEEKALQQTIKEADIIQE